MLWRNCRSSTGIMWARINPELRLIPTQLLSENTALVAYRSQELARRTAKFACAILAGLVGSALLTLLPRIPAAVADDCLTAPTGDKADGQHWRYRLERGRRCWYLKDSTAATQNNAEDTTPRQANQAPSAWDFAQPTPPKLTTRRGNGPASRVSTDALADDDARGSAKPQPGATPSLVRTQPATSFDESLQRNAA